MQDFYLGQIIMIAFDFAPQGWMICDGSLLSTTQYSNLYTLIGTTFGGDGTSTFALPDLRGRTPVSYSGKPQMPAGASNPITFSVGDTGGSETVVLTQSQMPLHLHPVTAFSGSATDQTPGGNVWATEATGQFPVYSNGMADATMSSQAIGMAGGGQGHPNMQPYVVVNYCIYVAPSGLVPPRSTTQVSA